MTTEVLLLLSPAEQLQLSPKKLQGATCVVFDVLRATSTLVMALHHGAKQVTVVKEIDEALALHAQNPRLLLAGERGGQRILKAQTGSFDFHFGNSPREFTQEAVNEQSIVLTTTNGTRALQACRSATRVLAGSFLNLSATAQALQAGEAERIILVCAGTGNETAYEDTLAAGAILEILPKLQFQAHSDACLMARRLYQQLDSSVEDALAQSINGRRLATNPELKDDIKICAQVDSVPVVVTLQDGTARLEV